jgi:hypothetical protein
MSLSLGAAEGSLLLCFAVYSAEAFTGSTRPLLLHSVVVMLTAKTATNFLVLDLFLQCSAHTSHSSAAVCFISLSLPQRRARQVAFCSILSRALSPFPEATPSAGARGGVHRTMPFLVSFKVLRPATPSCMLLPRSRDMSERWN